MPTRSGRGGSKKSAAQIMSESPEKTAGQIQAKPADDLKSREYRDSSGNVHHHTRRYMEQHKEIR
ncbi:MAG: hypothetical protein ACM3S5_13415 [Rhodospirillales bacterium]